MLLVKQKLKKINFLYKSIYKEIWILIQIFLKPHFDEDFGWKVKKNDKIYPNIKLYAIISKIMLL